MTGLLAAVLLCSMVAPVGAETVKVAGSGGMIPLVNGLAKAYMKKYPKETIEVNQNSLGKEGGIMALTKGAIDVAMLSTYGDKDRALPIVPTAIAVVPALFAVHPSVTAKALTGQQACDIYSGKITNWKQVGGSDAPIVVLTRPENESVKISVRSGLACFGALTESPKAISLAKAKDMSDTLVKTPNAIGLINTVVLDELGDKVVAPKFDGKDVRTTGPSQWPMKATSYLATGKTPSEAAKRFLQFVKSPEGAKVIKQEKAFPVQ
jgi:phosphate transport system substrate-binding protein